LQKYLMIALGGSLGAITVIGLVLQWPIEWGQIPLRDICDQYNACLILGFALVFLDRRTELSLAWRFLIPIGFIGAYSTFSTFEWETFATLQTGAFLQAALYVVLSFFLGLSRVVCVLLARAVS